MEFTFHTIYDQRAMTAAARVLRKTVRKRKNRCIRFICWIYIILVLLLTLPLILLPYAEKSKFIPVWLSVLAALCLILFEDSINAKSSIRKAIPGTLDVISSFTEMGFRSKTAVMDHNWRYESILRIVEIQDYFVFIFNKYNVEICDKREMTGGTAEEFARFITEKTGKPVEKLK